MNFNLNNGDGMKNLENNGFTNDGFYHELSDDVKQTNVLPQLTVARAHYGLEDMHSELKYEKPKRDLYKSALKKLSQINAKECFFSVFPILSWLPNYPWKTDFLSDFIAGCTVAVMHIPQGMGYALLGNVPAIVGIYMAFFPVLLYFIFGTSKHNSMGTFAVVSIMVGKSVLMYANSETIAPSYNSTTGYTDSANDPPIITPMQVATVICFTVGFIQLGMFVLRLGVISFLLSETLVSGFTTGAAIHVLTSQVKDLLGLSLPPITGYLQVVLTYVEIFNRILSVNLAAVTLSTITIVVLVINNEILKPRVAKRSKLPIPIELIAVITGTLVSKYMYLNENYNVKTIGTIPTGIPSPKVPDLSLVGLLAMDSFTIAMVSYTVSVSMGLIFAQKLNYEISFNQELLAMGLGNVFGSFFSCMPFSTSLSRSLIQQTVGGKSQISSIISCTLLLFVLLWIAPFFEPLPRCVLSGIIVVSLKGMIMQLGDFWKFWTLSKVDGIVWFVTFFTVVLASIDVGLLVGILLSLASLFFKSMQPYTCLLGQIPNADIYLDIKRYKGVKEVPNIKIYHYSGSLNFASRASFKSELLNKLKINLTLELKKMASSEKINYKPLSFKCIIIDFSSLCYIDPSGVSALRSIITDFSKLRIYIFVAGSSSPVYEMMTKCKLVEAHSDFFRLFPTIHDAVHFTEENCLKESPCITVIQPNI